MEILGQKYPKTQFLVKVVNKCLPQRSWTKYTSRYNIALIACAIVSESVQEYKEFVREV
jgi:intracellular septation protein A